jgi:type IV secretory pathway VirB2 component (pilin)
MEAWTNFLVITGGASAALVGLLFVAVSIRADAISKSKGLRSRLAQVLTLFLGLLASCILVSLPNPARWVLGVELAVAALLIGTALAILDHRAERGSDRLQLERILDRLSPNVTTAVLIGLSGIALIFGFDWGLYFLALAALVGFIGGAIGAWLVLVRPEG